MPHHELRAELRKQSHETAHASLNLLRPRVVFINLSRYVRREGFSGSVPRLPPPNGPVCGEGNLDTGFRLKCAGRWRRSVPSKVERVCRDCPQLLFGVATRARARLRTRRCERRQTPSRIRPLSTSAMDTSYLTQQVGAIMDQLHGLFDEIGVPSHEREARETEVRIPRLTAPTRSTRWKAYLPRGHSCLRRYQLRCTTKFARWQPRRRLCWMTHRE